MTVPHDHRQKTDRGVDITAGNNPVPSRRANAQFDVVRITRAIRPPAYDPRHAPLPRPTISRRDFHRVADRKAGRVEQCAEHYAEQCTARRRGWFTTLLILTVALPLGVMISATIGAATAHAQPRRPVTPTDSLVREALDKVSLGDTSTALDLLQRATDQSPRDVNALYWRGLILSRTTALSLIDEPRRWMAGHLLSRASDIDPRNPRYLIELGRLRLKTPLRRVEAERLFRKALAVAKESGDPLQIAETAYELGEVKQRRYLTGRDRWMYTTTNVIFDPIAARARLHYTREFLQSLAQPIENAAQVDRQEAEELFREGLKAMPTHAPSAVGLMGLLYDQRRYDEMRRVAEPIVRLDTAPARVLFAAGLATYRLGQLARADTLFNRALARFTPAERNEITSLGRITRKADSIRIDELSEAERARTEQAYWEAADPLLATPENEAKLEYLARMAFADLRFSDDDTRQVGWRTDRGLIIARYGEPPVVATFPPSSDADAKDAVGRIITVWYYPRTEVEFVFTGPPAMNAAFFAGNHRGYAEEQRQEAPFLLDNVPLAIGVDTIPVQMARFRGNKADNGQLVIAASVPVNRMYKGAEIDRGSMELSLRRGPLAATRRVRADTGSVALPVGAPLTRLYVDTLQAGANVRVRLEARDAALAGATARAQADLTMLPGTSPTLESSDLVLANRLASPGTVVGRWNEINLQMRPNLSFAQRDTFSVYWENYGLRPDANGRVQYEVRMIVTLEQEDRGQNSLRRLLGSLSDVVGLSKEGEEALGLRFERNESLGDRDRVPELVTLGLGSAPPGRYRLEVIVTDRQSKQVTRLLREFFLTRQ